MVVGFCEEASKNLVDGEAHDLAIILLAIFVLFIVIGNFLEIRFIFNLKIGEKLFILLL